MAALDHKHILDMGNVSYNQFVVLMHQFYTNMLDLGKHIAFENYWYGLALQGEKTLEREFARRVTEAEGSVTYMLDKLMKDKDVAVVDPILSPTMDSDTRDLYKAITELPVNPITLYEKKMFLKYAGDSSRRTGEGYTAQIMNYLPGRKEWRKAKMPNMGRYERALRLYHQLCDTPISYDGNLPYESLRGYLSRARSTTFGGYPYLRNMGDFVSEDESDDTTYADLYNELAIAFSYLPPAMKVKYNVSFVALERVQPGGVDVYDPTKSLEEQEGKKNKQRFVQAQSAMISHCYKFLVDGLNIHMRAHRPTMYADKFGEPMVTQEMKRLASIAFGKDKPAANDVSVYYNVVGTDYTNFDASQDVAISNDTGYQIWRRLAPAWMCYYLIDPYVKITYGSASILVPKYGIVRTTGVKSGMADTNMTDTCNCGLADAYELCYYSDVHEYLDDDTILGMLHYTMDNGDDRYKLTVCDASDIEAADGELSFIAQKSKQEVLMRGMPVRKFNITYLKTILGWTGTQLVRTDAVSKLILARMHPESHSGQHKPCSLVMDFIMSAARSAESPYLYILVDYMYKRVPLFANLVDGTTNMQAIIDGMVSEQMEELRLTKGRKWMRRKGMDYDMIIERMNAKYGYGDEGYRGSVGALTSHATGVEELPQYQAIMACAYRRKLQGVIGETFTLNN